MYCSKCGTEIQPGAKFCPKCGTPAPQADNGVPAAENSTPASSGNYPSPSSQPNTPLFIGVIVAVAAVVVGIGIWVWFAFFAPYPVDEFTFPDAAVRTVVASTVDSDGNGEVSRDEAAKVTDFTVDGAANLDGVERFPNIRTLAVKGSSLSSADIGPFGSLETFTAPDSALTTLDVSRNPGLKTLQVPDSTKVTGIEVTNLEETWLPTSIVVSEKGSDGSMVKDEVYELVRDAHGNPLKYVDSNYSTGSLSTTYTNEYTYNDAEQMVEAKRTTQGSYSSDGTETRTYSYDDTGRLTTRVANGKSGQSTAEYKYNDAGQLVALVSTSSSGTVTTTDIEYNELGEAVALPTGDGCASRRWYYNDEGELTGFARAYGDAFTLTNQMFTFDEQGNVVSVELTGGDPTLPEFEKYGIPDFHRVVEYSYDENGRLVSGSFDGKAYGTNMVNSVTCEYDAEGRRTKVDYISEMDILDETSVSEVVSEESYGRYFIPSEDQRNKTFLYLEPSYEDSLFNVYPTNTVIPTVPSLEARYRAAEFLVS